MRHSPPESALYKAMYPPDEDSLWGLPEMLLAEAADSLRWLVWAKTEDGQKNRNHPHPIPRPGVEPPTSTRRSGGTTTTSIDDAPARYAVERIPSS